jgi:hypothetical protein
MECEHRELRLLKEEKKTASVSWSRHKAAVEIQGHSITTNNTKQQPFGSQQMFS